MQDIPDPCPKIPQTNPYVVAIIPEPIDYFRACGLTSICRSRCRAEINAFEAANANPTIHVRNYTVRTNSPFFIDLDEGAVTPMTIIAIAEVNDCLHICGPRLEREQEDNPDRCIAIAGAVGDSDLTMMTYCVPSLPGSGVRRFEAWTIPGTLGIMNSIVDAQYIDLERGEGILVLREVENRPLGLAPTDNFFRSRLDALWRGDTYHPTRQPLIGEGGLIAAINAPEEDRIEPRRITGIIVQPPPTGSRASDFPLLYAEVLAVQVIPSPRPARTRLCVCVCAPAC